MGNCQAAEAATVVIHHPGSKVERIYWSVSAHEVMTSNPGHYVALVLTSSTARVENGRPVKQLKLLRPDDTLLMGQVYRLICFEDVLKEFAAKKCVKLGKLLKERGGFVLDKKKDHVGPAPSTRPKPAISNGTSVTIEREVIYRAGSSGRVVGRHHSNNSSSSGMGQWKPALQSIAEIGT